MEICFVTGNGHKVEEAQIALAGSGIKIHILEANKEEPDDWKLEKVAYVNAKRIAHETKKVVIIEDTGVFFEAFDNFPGNKPKRYFEKLGYKGLLAMFDASDANDNVEITNRKAYFRTIIGYCEPGQEPILFSGELDGVISKEVKGMDANVLPYERIFICNEKKDGENENTTHYLYEYTREEKGKFSHRAKAFRKLKQYLLSKN
jgi:XTP/dITP diphosphohydrolase